MRSEAATWLLPSKKARTTVETAAAKEVARMRMETTTNGMFRSRTTGTRPRYAVRTALKSEPNALRILFI